jgi:type I restriction enzyme S subunit
VAAVVPSTLPDANCADLVVITPSTGDLDAHYLAAVFNSTWGKAAVSGNLVGVAQQHFNIGAARNLLVELPEIAVQRRIAGILSAYDDLIENCERRIRVLDEMARALYREWFVLFRYPGHEQTPLLHSALGRIPRGWQCSDVASVADGPEGVQTGPFGSQLHQEEYAAEGIPVVMPKDLRGFRIDEEDIARVPEEVAERVSRHRMKVGDIVYGRRGDIGRRAFVMDHQVGTICGTGCLRIRPDVRAVDGWYLFNYLGQDDVVALISGRAQGVTMPNLNTKLLATVPIIVPPRALQGDFAARTFDLAVQREALFAMMRNLRQSRNLLLPRLLSGQLSLEDAA